MIRDGRAAEVRPALETLAGKDPSNLAVRASLAMAYEAEGRLEDSVSAWRAAWSLSPESPAVSEGLRRALRTRLLARYRNDLATTAQYLAGLPLVKDPDKGEPGTPPPAPPTQIERFERPIAPGGGEPVVDGPDVYPVDRVPVEEPSSFAVEDLRVEHPWVPVEADPRVDETTVSEPPATASEPESSGAPAEEDPYAPVWQPMDEPVMVPVPAPADPAPPPAGTIRDDSDLDELIRELESARIVPDPTVRPVDVRTIEPDVEDVVSETLARIYSNQRFYEEAAAVYEKLAAQQPARADEFRRKAAEIRGRITR